METPVGSTLSFDAFEPPFDNIVRELIEKGRALHELLADHMWPQWRRRPLEFFVIDDASLNAFARDAGSSDHIYILRGAVEHIYGTMLGLLSTPLFFPTIGDTKTESLPHSLPGGRFPSVNLLRTTGASDELAPMMIPNDQARVTLAEILAEVALEFLIYHEIGHIVGGHLEILRRAGCATTIAEFQQSVSPDDFPLQHLLECDADLFASDVTSSVYTHDHWAELLQGVFSASSWASRDLAMVSYLQAIGVLFRVLQPSAPHAIDEFDPSHPHPAVRGCLVASSTMARALADGRLSVTSLDRIVADSVGNVEDVWASLCLSGHNPEPSLVWAQLIRDTAMGLFRSYGDSRHFLQQHARLPRNWDNWKWPETDASDEVG